MTKPLDPGATILTINAGSSSLKFAVYAATEPLRRVLSGRVEKLGRPEAEMTINDIVTGEKKHGRISADGPAACVEPLLGLLEAKAFALGAIGHRVVHGGLRYRDPQPVTDEMLAELRRLSQFDPEHLPAEIALIEEFRRRHPEAAQVACFDTAFHRDLPQVARLLPLPRRYFAQGVQRYGFHGLSFDFLMRELRRIGGATAANGRVILAHLGNGASLAAVLGGRSMDTTMAFTPTAGLVMGTRTGDLDPGIVAYLARTESMTVEQFGRMVNAESGLLGVSEISADIRDLLERERGDERAAEALALFCYQAKKWMGAFAAVLNGLDTLVFAGGIGENSPIIRSRICAGLGFLGLELDAERNEAGAPVISADGSRVTVRVIPTDEELVIAQAAFGLMMDSRER
jgi:acetate kinase